MRFRQTVWELHEPRRLKGCFRFRFCVWQQTHIFHNGPSVSTETCAVVQSVGAVRQLARWRCGDGCFYCEQHSGHTCLWLMQNHSVTSTLEHVILLYVYDSAFSPRCVPAARHLKPQCRPSRCQRHPSPPLLVSVWLTLSHVGVAARDTAVMLCPVIDFHVDANDFRVGLQPSTTLIARDA